MQEKQVQSLGQKNPLEKEMATHSSILALENPRDRGDWQATVHRVGCKESDTAEHTCTSTHHTMGTLIKGQPPMTPRTSIRGNTLTDTTHPGQVPH